MAINTNKEGVTLTDTLGNSVQYARLQMRGGNEADFDPSKMLPREFAVMTDTEKLYIAFAPGKTKQFMTVDGALEEVKEKADEILASLPEDYILLSNKVNSLSDEIDKYEKSINNHNLLDDSTLKEKYILIVEGGYLYPNDYWNSYVDINPLSNKIIISKDTKSTFHVNIVFFNNEEKISGSSKSENTDKYEIDIPDNCTKMSLSVNVHDDNLVGLKVICVTDVGSSIIENKENIKNLQDKTSDLLTTEKLLLDESFYDYPKAINFENKYSYSLENGQPKWEVSQNYRTLTLHNNINIRIQFTNEIDTTSEAMYLLSFIKEENGLYSARTFNVNDLFLYNIYINGEVYGIKYTIDVDNRSVVLAGNNENVTIYVTLREGHGYIEYLQKRNPDWLQTNPKEIFVASSGATEEEKQFAKYVCDGINDEKEINQAIKEIGRQGIIKLSSGIFNIESFTKYNENDERTAIFTSQSSFEISIEGTSRRNNYGTVLYVSEKILEQINDDEQVNVISGYGIGSSINVGNVQFKLENNQHPIVCYNGSNLGAGYLHDSSAFASENNDTATQTIPNEKCVAFRSYHGDDNGIQTIWESIIAVGFGRAFQLGGEHHILLQCSGRYNFCTYTFGEYPVKLGNAFSHPITLINCCDEHQCLLPQFYKCGAMVEEDAEGHPLQEVDFITFNIERWQDWKEYQSFAKEENIGDFCGRIEYTMNGVTPSSYEEWSGTKNLKHAQFWENGNGINFITRNMTHRLGGTTELRRSYYPNYMQEYFDTDLKKKVIYDGENWLDFNGNVVE